MKGVCHCCKEMASCFQSWFRRKYRMIHILHRNFHWMTHNHLDDHLDVHLDDHMVMACKPEQTFLG